MVINFERFGCLYIRVLNLQNKRELLQVILYAFLGNVILGFVFGLLLL